MGGGRVGVGATVAGGADEDVLLLAPAEAGYRRLCRLLSLRNDVGLLAEEYDPRIERMVGNFPQAFSHVGLVNTALNLQEGCTPRNIGP